MPDKRRKVFLSQSLAADDQAPMTERWYTVAKCGRYYDWRYGTFEVNRELLLAIKRNFDANVFGVKIALDCNHEPDHKAMAWVAELAVEGDDMRARFEDWTPEGEKAVTDGEYRYFSIEFGPFDRPVEGDRVETVPDVLMGIAMTNRPVLKGMDGTFAEKEREANKTGDEPDKGMAMIKVVQKFADSLLASGTVTGADSDRLQVMLSELPPEDRKAFSGTEEKVKELAAEGDKKLAEAKELAEKREKELADVRKLADDLAADNAKYLAEAKAKEAGEVVESMILSDKVKKGFSSVKREAVEGFVAKFGAEAGKAMAAMLSDVTDTDGKTEEIGTGEDVKEEKEGEVSGELAEADRKLATERSKESGKPVHIELAAIISQRQAQKK